MEFTSLTPISKIQLAQQLQPQSISERPLDRPTLVRPQRTSTVLIQNSNEAENHLLMMQRQMSSPSVVDPSMMMHYQQQQQLTEQPYYPNQQLTYAPDPGRVAKKTAELEAPEKLERIEVIPMNLEKPTGLEMGDFLPMKFQMMGLGGNTLGGCDTSRFAGFKSFQNDASESEVSLSILKGHESMMAALTNRGRQIEIIQKLWQNKDAKTGTFWIKSNFRDESINLNFPLVFRDFANDTKAHYRFSPWYSIL